MKIIIQIIGVLFTIVNLPVASDLILEDPYLSINILDDVKNISISEGTHTVWRAHQRTSRRNGKGFSLSELQDAGVSVLSARLMGLYVDLRRGTKHEENVSMLKSRTQK